MVLCRTGIEGNNYSVTFGICVECLRQLLLLSCHPRVLCELCYKSWKRIFHRIHGILLLLLLILFSLSLAHSIKFSLLGNCIGALHKENAAQDPGCVAATLGNYWSLFHRHLFSWGPQCGIVDLTMTSISDGGFVVKNMRWGNFFLCPMKVCIWKAKGHVMKWPGNVSLIDGKPTRNVD